MNPVDETQQLTEADVHRIVDERIAQKGFVTTAEIEAIRVHIGDARRGAQMYTDLQIRDVEARTSNTLGNFRQTLVDVRENFERTMTSADTTIKGWGSLLQTSNQQVLALQHHIERVDAKANANESNIDDIVIRMGPLSTAVFGSDTHPSLFDLVQQNKQDMQRSIEDVSLALAEQIDDVNTRVDGLEASLTSISSIWERWDKVLSRVGRLLSGKSGAALVGGVPPVLIWVIDKVIDILTG